jgi:hypothetical protein
MIYGEGRSRAIHGTSSRIGHDWAHWRSIAEQIAGQALFSCLDWVGSNPRGDTPELLKK